MNVSDLVMSSEKSIELLIETEISPRAGVTGPGVRREVARTQKSIYPSPVLMEFFMLWGCKGGPSTWNPVLGRPHFCECKGSRM